ncbi:MAG: protein TolR [Candidatus Dadabacteria bacterium RIFCSPHIGHO2_12_FULL_53_21]|nr:MAG: protein TolR [Candidatus Dadabacteria bacterium RIFCSPHIGHO2_12_FULL_53_21]
MQTGKEGRTVMSEINVTPFVDVMLVLLVIFMVTTPILYQGVDVDLPNTESRPMPSLDQERKVVVTLNKDGEIFIEKQRYTLNELRIEIRKVMAERGKNLTDEDVFLRADSSVPYGTVVEVMSEIRNAGVQKIGLITEPVPNDGQR